MALLVRTPEESGPEDARLADEVRKSLATPRSEADDGCTIAAAERLVGREEPHAAGRLAQGAPGHRGQPPHARRAKRSQIVAPEVDGTGD
jgi:hypothetical protein